jgi:hypothetical protein
VSCNCGAKAQAKINFVYTHPKTKAATTYKSEIEARAAQIRNGGGTYTAVPAR